MRAVPSPSRLGPSTSSSHSEEHREHRKEIGLEQQLDVGCGAVIWRSSLLRLRYSVYNSLAERLPLKRRTTYGRVIGHYTPEVNG